MAKKVVLDPYYARVILGDMSNNCTCLVFYSVSINFDAVNQALEIMEWINSSIFINRLTANAVVCALSSVFTVVRTVMRR